MDKFVGKRLDGRYEIKEIIGVGGMAVVYKAHDNQENRTVAVKILKEEFISNEEFLRRFKNESKAIAMLSHPNIVKVFDVSFGDLIQYIVMEYIEGITLKEYIEREGSLRWKDAVHFTLQILKGLQHAHDKGIVHRDVKPQNIMVLPDGTIKVTDFGIARFARSEQRTITDKAIGSVHYISPEQARGEKTDEKADIYSVGVMLYEMLTGQLPFQAESAVSVAIMQLQRDPQLPTELNGSIPLGLEQITMHAMQKNPERRYQSAAEMLCDLGQFRKDPAVTFDYSYFVDDSPTKFIQDVEPEYVSPAASQTAPEETKEKNNMIPILAGIAVTLVIAIVVLGILFIPKLFTSTGEEIECPNFVGEKLEDITANDEYTDMFDFKVEWEENADFAYGIVYKQSKNAGQKMKKGGEIILNVSKGQTTIEVPDLFNKNEETAISELNNLGLKYERVEMPSEEIKEGFVVKTDPLKTTTVAEGTTIKVYVSTGKPTKYVEVPDVTKMKKEDAEEKLKKLNLIAQFEDTFLSSDEYLPEGYIISQEPSSDSDKIAEGETVTLKVSNGKYKFDTTISSLPDDYKYEKGKVSLWKTSTNDGDPLAVSNEISFATDKKVTFKEIIYKPDSASDKTLVAYVKFSGVSGKYDKYLKIEINVKTGEYKTTETYSYPKKTDATEPTSPTSPADNT